MVREHDGGHLVERRVEDVVRRAEQEQRAQACVPIEPRRAALLGRVEDALVAAEGRPQLGGVAEGLGVEVDHRRPAVGPEHHRCVTHERSRVRPEARRVEGGDVAAPLLGRGEVGGEPVGVESLAHEVVGRLARRAGVHARHALLVVGQRRVEQDHALDRAPGARGPASWTTGPPRSPPQSTTRSSPSPSVSSACRSADVRGHVVEPVRARRRCRRSRGGRGR